MNRREFFSTFTTAAGVLLLRPRSDGSLRKDLYRIHPLSERGRVETYIRILHDACGYAERDWHDSSFDPAAGFWGDGVSGGNGGIRTIASMALGCGALIKFDNDLSADDRRDLLNKATAALRFATATHVTDTRKCTDGKQWGATEKFGPESWQSGMWTGTLAFGAWLIWEKLDAALRQRIQRVIAWEDDILAGREPPTGLWKDTKAEENGWEVPCLVLGELMFPAHPRAAAWRDAALKYMMNTLCTEADMRDTRLVDGRAVNERVRGANLQPDFTLENHGIFHPSYVGCSCYFLTQAAMYYTHAGRPIPQAATHHLMDTWRMFRTIILPWGEAAYPQGMDWELHGLTFLNLFASLATHWKDPFAALMEQSALQYLRAWQTMCRGSLAIPGSPLGFVRHAINVEQASYGFLAHKVFGPIMDPIMEMTARAATYKDRGVRDYSYVGFIAHRTEMKFASFSWRNKIMGMIIPIGEGHEGNPDFTVPIQDGFVGSFEVDPAGDIKEDKKITVVEHDRKRTDDGFETAGTLLLHSGRLQQKIKMTSIGSQTVVYEDEVTALAGITVKKELGIPFGIENDEITGGARVVTSRDARTVVNWRDPKPPLAIQGRWVNVDGRVGVVSIAGSGLSYAHGSGYLPGISVCADKLYGSYFDRPRQFRAGDVVARRLAVFLVEVTPQQMSRFTESYRIDEQDGVQMLRFKQPDGKDCKVQIAFGRLESLRINS